MKCASDKCNGNAWNVRPFKFKDYKVSTLLFCFENKTHAFAALWEFPYYEYSDLERKEEWEKWVDNFKDWVINEPKMVDLFEYK